MKKNKLSMPAGIAIALTGAVLLGGCSNHDTINFPVQSADEEPAQTQSAQPATETATAAVETESISATTQEETENGVDTETAYRPIPQLAITDKSQKWYSDDGEVLLLEAETSIVSVTNSGFDNLSSALDKLSAQIEGSVLIYGDEIPLKQLAEEHYQSQGDPFANYYCGGSLYLSRMDAVLVSLIYEYSSFMGGAHGNYGTSGYTYDVESGTELTLSDLLTDKEGFYESASSYIIDTLYEQYGEGLFPEYAATVSENLPKENGVNFYLDTAGIVIAYSPYDVGPYAMGPVRVTLSYEKFGKYMKQKYLPLQGNLAAPLKANDDISSVLGFTGPVMIEVIWDDYEFEGITIISGSASDESIEAERFVNAYILRTAPDQCLLAVSADYASDDYVTYLYAIGDNHAALIGEPINGTKLTGRQIGPDGMELEKHLNVLGTYTSRMFYTLQADGTLVPSEKVYQIQSSIDMTVKKDLPVTIDGTQTTLPAGSTLRITGTDDNGTAYFTSGDGKNGSISYTSREGEWELYINDISENEYFEMIPYVG